MLSFNKFFHCFLYCWQLYPKQRVAGIETTLKKQSCPALLNYVQLCWIMSSSVELCPALLNYVQLCWIMSSSVELCPALLNYVQLCWIMSSSVELCPALLNYVQLCWIMSSTAVSVLFCGEAPMKQRVSFSHGCNLLRPRPISLYESVLVEMTRYF